MKIVFYAGRYYTRDEMWSVIEAAGTIICNMLNLFQWTRILGPTGLSYIFTVIVEYFNIFCKLLVTGQIPLPFTPNTLFLFIHNTLFVHFSLLVLLVATTRQRSGCDHICI
jgi:hypothetical protein